MPRDDSPGGDRGSWGGSGRDRQQRPTVFPVDSEQDKLDKEKLDILDGTRNKKPAILRRAAVRIEDLTGLLQMPANLQSPRADPAGPAPSAAQFAQLQDDVTSLHRQLMVVAETLRKQLT